MPLATIVMPQMPPTHECVVDTGISYLVARMSQMPTARMTENMPYIRMAGSSS